MHGAQLGDGNVQTNVFGTATLLPATAIAWPIRVGVIPAPASCLQSRTEMNQLDTADPGRTETVTQVLSGLGGVGKTQLAAAYARSRSDVDLRVWVTAGSRDAILAGYADLAARLGHRTMTDTEQAATWFLGWLQANTIRSWLIVLDDLADPADLAGLWPQGAGGQVVVTTRRRDAILSGSGRRRIDVQRYTREQAGGYLAARLGSALEDGHRPDVVGLADDLGLLPLALAQAAAFMLDRSETCSRYRARLADRRRTLAELLPADALADDYRATVVATWSISIDAADRLAPAGTARPVLELLGVLDPNGIPVDLLTTAAVGYVTEHRGAAADPAPRRAALDAQDITDALHNLARFSLITVDHHVAAEGEVRVHELVQRAATEHLDPTRFAGLCEAAAAGLTTIWPEVELHGQFGQSLRSNAQALQGRAGDRLWTPVAHPVLRRIGDSLGECGLVDDAITQWTWLAAECQRRLGPDHVDTLTARGKVACWRGEAGDPVAALADSEQLLADCVRVLGPDDPITLTCRHDVASWQGGTGDAAGAVDALDLLLADRVRVLGAEHPDTLRTRSQLAFWRGEVGDVVGAVQANETLLADRLRVLGPDDPKTLTTRNNLAHWRGKAGDAAGAAADLEQLVADRRRVGGPDHTKTQGPSPPHAPPRPRPAR